MRHIIMLLSLLLAFAGTSYSYPASQFPQSESRESEVPGPHQGVVLSFESEIPEVVQPYQAIMEIVDQRSASKDGKSWYSLSLRHVKAETVKSGEVDSAMAMYCYDTAFNEAEIFVIHLTHFAAFYIHYKGGEDNPDGRYERLYPPKGESMTAPCMKKPSI